ITSKVDWSEIRIGSHYANVQRVDSQNLADNVRQNRIRSLTDVRAAAKHRDQARTIQFQLHARLRHVVPVNRKSGSREIAATGKADTPAKRQLAELLFPARRFNHFLDALAQTDGADRQPVGGQRIRFHQILETQFCGIQAEQLCRLVELNLNAE